MHRKCSVGTSSKHLKLSVDFMCEAGKTNEQKNQINIIR